jgi:hypothetical protein
MIVASDPAIRLSEALRIIFESRGEHGKAERVRLFVEAYYADPLLRSIRLGEYLIGNGVITPGELEHGLAAQSAEQTMIAEAPPEEREAVLRRILARAEATIEEAQIVIGKGPGK